MDDAPPEPDDDDDDDDEFDVPLELDEESDLLAAVVDPVSDELAEFPCGLLLVEL